MLEFCTKFTSMSLSVKELIQKYNVPGPRYTSYPTVPYWEGNLSLDSWKNHVQEQFKASNTSEGISLYIHLPYCNTACHYCGCNMKYTQNHSVEEPYIKYVLKEWAMYLSLFDERPNIAELHLGGGTPTFFSPQNLKQLIDGIFEHASAKQNIRMSFEASPNSTSLEHLQTLYDLGFRRLSLGIQDFDPLVQMLINRFQSVELVAEVVANARKVGYTSINFDVIYGLPKQTLDSIKNTFEAIREMRPERIAYYSYAHVPWIKGIQRRFNESDLPENHEKRKLYELGKQLLFEDGYVEIGMDHFALQTDELYSSMVNKTLHRNFMGYTADKTSLMIGLGMSSIGDSWTAFAQNHKSIRDYQKALDAGDFPLFRGHQLNEEDLFVRQHILYLMCKFETSWDDTNPFSELFDEALFELEEMQKDGLIAVQANSIRVLENGKAFVRNVCMAFDARLNRNKPERRIFSATI